MSQSRRPKYLSLYAIAFQIRLPVTGWVSLIHRLSGVYLLISCIAAVCWIEVSLRSVSDFAMATSMTKSPFVRVALLLSIWTYAHHLLAGIRFLVLDLDVGASRQAAVASAWAVHGVGLLMVVLSGWLLW